MEKTVKVLMTTMKRNAAITLFAGELKKIMNLSEKIGGYHYLFLEFFKNSSGALEMRLYPSREKYVETVLKGSPLPHRFFKQYPYALFSFKILKEFNRCDNRFLNTLYKIVIKIIRIFLEKEPEVAREFELELTSLKKDIVFRGYEKILKKYLDRSI